MKDKVVVLTSGGMDSATLLYYHVKRGDEVRAIAFNYGQRHLRELEYARGNAEGLGVPLTVVDLSMLAQVIPSSSQTDHHVEVPQGRFDEESMKLTVVPNRNMILLSVAFGHALAHQMGFVSYAAHAGDHTIYPDCRPEFAEWINQGPSTGLCDWHKVGLLRPFIHITKADIVRIGTEMGVDYSQTWSCYCGEDLHCGRCGTCVERRQAFFLAGEEDPTRYSPTAPAVEEMVKNDWFLPGSTGKTP